MFLSPESGTRLERCARAVIPLETATVQRRTV
jgi:hypothetical protein